MKRNLSKILVVLSLLLLSITCVFADVNNLSSVSKYTVTDPESPIRSFSAEYANNVVKFKWNLDSKSSDYADIKIYASSYNVSKKQIYTEKFVFNGQQNKSGEVTVDNLSTGIYTFDLEVDIQEEQDYDDYYYYNYYGSNTRSYNASLDKAIYVASKNAPDKLKNIKIGSVDGKMFAKWDREPEQNYLLTIYDSQLKVLKQENLNTNSTNIELPDGLNSAKISVSYVKTDKNSYNASSYYDSYSSNENIGKFDIYDVVNTTPTGEVIFPNFSVTNKSVIPVVVECPYNTTADIYVDKQLLSSETEKVTSGSYDINLSEGKHNILVAIKDSNGNMKTFSKKIEIDKKPPTVNLNTSDDVKTSLSYFVIEGSTEPNAIVTINGVEQELGSGKFTAKVKLASGPNVLTIAAYDAAGNKSVRTITVENTAGYIVDFNTLKYGVAAFLVLAIWYTFLNKRARKHKKLLEGGETNTPQNSSDLHKGINSPVKPEDQSKLNPNVQQEVQKVLTIQKPEKAQETGDIDKTEQVDDIEDSSGTEELSSTEDSSKTEEIDNTEESSRTEEVNDTEDSIKTEEVNDTEDFNKPEENNDEKPN